MMKPLGAGFVCARASRTPTWVVQSNLRSLRVAAVDGSDRFSFDEALLCATSDRSLKSSSRGANTYWRQGVRRDDAGGYMLARTACARSKQVVKLPSASG